MIDNGIEIIFKILEYLCSPRDDKTCHFDFIARKIYLEIVRENKMKMIR